MKRAFLALLFTLLVSCEENSHIYPAWCDDGGQHEWGKWSDTSPNSLGSIQQTRTCLKCGVKRCEYHK